jgi:hypothetical protein
MSKGKTNIKKTLFLLPILFVLSCSSNKNNQLELSCETFFTQDKVEEIFNTIEYISEDLDDRDIMEKIALNAVLTTFINFSKECIEKNYPLEKHIFIFNEKNLENFGEYEISKSSSNCLVTKDSLIETLSVMKVTNKFIDFGERSLRVNKKNMTTGTKLFYIQNYTLGPYQYSCNLRTL